MMAEDRLAKVTALLEHLARMTLPGDEDEAMKTRVQEAADDMGVSIAEADDDDVVESADSDFLCDVVHAFWRLAREARELLKATS
jgi:hypothetical protein